jgi:hypothetical protein
MNQYTESLWSPEIKAGVLSPRELLDLQALALREQSGGLLSAEVREAHDKAEGAVYLILDMVAANLPGARHRVLTARFFADRIYPCHLDADGLRGAEVAYSETDFRELVRQVLHSGEVKSLALSLIARVRDSNKENAESLVRRHNGHRRLFRPAWVGVEGDEEHAGTVEALYDESHGID